MKNQHIALLLFALLFACSSPEDPSPDKPKEDTSQKDISLIDESIESFMTKFSVPGASLAIAKNGKLVYRKAYGMADKEKGEKVTLESRFRLASVSKTYTGVAIMKLIEAGHFSLDDKVFGSGALLGTEYGKKSYSQSVKSITVRQLLQMTTGCFLTSNNRDAIDAEQQLNNEDFFNWMMDNGKFAFEPGTNFQYINTNFFIAGRIIEKFSGKSFTEYIKELLKPTGEKTTDLANRSISNKLPNEVTYYGQGSVANFEYGFNIERRDADGGLVTTATDLLRFVLAIDGQDTRKDIITNASLVNLTTASTFNPGYGCGIGVSGSIKFNYGMLPGTRTGFMWNSNGMAVVLLLNASPDYFNTSQTNSFVRAKEDILLDLVRNPNKGYQDIDQF